MRGNWEPPEWEGIPDPRTAFHAEMALGAAILALLLVVLFVQHINVNQANEKADALTVQLTASRLNTLALAKKLDASQARTVVTRQLLAEAQLCIGGMTGTVLALLHAGPSSPVIANSALARVRQECHAAIAALQKGAT